MQWIDSINNNNISKIDNRTTVKINIKILENIELIILLYLHHTEADKKTNLGNIEWIDWIESIDISNINNNSKTIGKMLIERIQNIVLNNFLYLSRIEAYNNQCLDNIDKREWIDNIDHNNNNKHQHHRWTRHQWREW